MNQLFKFFGLLVLTVGYQLLSAEGRATKHEKVKYVQGGACLPGNGTKKHPYVSLDQAYLHTSEWDVLRVLSSTIPLDGGIVLHDGQKLIGEENPTLIGLSPTQPTITNTTSHNDGMGVIVNGNVTIENIHFTNTQNTAIQYDNAQDLTIKNLLITDYVGVGISGFCAHSGVTRITNLIIRDTAGTGIAEELAQPGIRRELLVCTMSVSLPTRGIRVFTNYPDTISSVRVKDAYFAIRNVGIECGNKGNLSVIVKDSSFHDSFSSGILMSTSGSSQAHTELEIDGCFFEQGEFATRISDEGSSTHVTLKNSVIEVTGTVFRSNILDSALASTQKICLRGNRARGEIFYSARNNAELPSGKTDAILEDNFFSGAMAVQINANTPWNWLTIDAEQNCFVGDGTEAALMSAQGPAGGALLTARKNSFSGFIPDIEELDSAGVFYDVTKNWWGHATPVACTPSSCVFAQTCIDGFCQGPVVIGTTKVLASDPLTASIQCPHNCCKRLSLP